MIQRSKRKTRSQVSLLPQIIAASRMSVTVIGSVWTVIRKAMGELYIG